MKDIRMGHKEYRKKRKSIGSQVKVAGWLGINKQTISNRERGIYGITSEAELALIHLEMIHSMADNTAMAKSDD